MMNTDFFKAIEPLSENGETLSGGFAVLTSEERNNALGGNKEDDDEVNRANKTCSDNKICKRNGTCANNKGECVGNSYCVNDIVVVPPSNPTNCFCSK